MATVITLMTVLAMVIISAQRGGYVGVLPFSAFQNEYEPRLLFPRTAKLMEETERFYAEQVCVI